MVRLSKSCTDVNEYMAAWQCNIGRTKGQIAIRCSSEPSRGCLLHLSESLAVSSKEWTEILDSAMRGSE